MYFKQKSLVEEATKSDFENNSNIFEVGYWGKSDDLDTIQKALIFTEKGLKFFENDNTTHGEYIKDEYSLVLSNTIAENEKIDSDTISYVYNTLCTGINAHLNTKIRDVVWKLARNPNTPQDIKDRILKEHMTFGDDEYIIGRLASNKNNSPEFIEDIYKNHQGQYIEFRSGMGCSWLNKNIAGNPNTPESVKLSMISDLPKIIEEKSKEFENMSNHPYHFNEIYKAIAENSCTSEGVLDKLYDSKDSFNQKMDFTYYIALNTKSPVLLDKIAEDKNNYNGIYQSLFRNKYLSPKTVDYIIETDSISTSEKTRLAFNLSVLNSSQLSALAKNLGNYSINNVEEILNHPICNKDVCSSLLENYDRPFKPNKEIVALIKDKIESYLKKEVGVEDLFGIKHTQNDIDEAMDEVQKNEKSLKVDFI